MVLYHHFTDGTSFIPYLNFASGNKDQVSIESDWDEKEYCLHWPDGKSSIHLIQKRLLWTLALGHWKAIDWAYESDRQTIASQCPVANAQSNLF